jgi:hypothetical protein
MTGRGRGATLPAWMTAGDPTLGIPPMNHLAANQPSNDRSRINNNNQAQQYSMLSDNTRDKGVAREKDQQDHGDRERDRRQQRRSKSRSPSHI